MSDFKNHIDSLKILYPELSMIFKRLEDLHNDEIKIIVSNLINNKNQNDYSKIEKRLNEMELKISLMEPNNIETKPEPIKLKNNKSTRSKSKKVKFRKSKIEDHSDEETEVYNNRFRVKINYDNYKNPIETEVAENFISKMMKD